MFSAISRTVSRQMLYPATAQPVTTDSAIGEYAERIGHNRSVARENEARAAALLPSFRQVEERLSSAGSALLQHRLRADHAANTARAWGAAAAIGAVVGFTGGILALAGTPIIGVGLVVAGAATAIGGLVTQGRHDSKRDHMWEDVKRYTSEVQMAQTERAALSACITEYEARAAQAEQAAARDEKDLHVLKMAQYTSPSSGAIEQSDDVVSVGGIKIARRRA